MNNKKIASAKDWRKRSIETWNVLTFTEYIRDAHKELFGIDYAPFGGTYAMEQGILGDLIGTRSRTNPKPRTASNEAVKRFIDVTFEGYTPNAKYPGTSFGFMWTYRKSEWQRIVANERSKERATKAREEDLTIDDLLDWL